MKKLILGLAILLVLSIISIYVFIPSTISVSAVSTINCSHIAGYRVMKDTSKWADFFDLSKNNEGGSFNFNDQIFSLTKILYYGFDVTISSGNEYASSTLSLLPYDKNTLAIEWKCLLHAGNNPITRILKYNEAVSIKKNMDSLLSVLKNKFDNPENIYGIKIKESSTTDTLLVAQKIITQDYPSTQDIYSVIESLKNFILSKKLLITGNPMINVTETNDHFYELMAALPTNKEVDTEDPFFFRRMVPGNFLTTIVKGGQQSVLNAQNEMQFFIADYRKVSMAINFQSLITNRSKETDTTKWITKLYFPVVE